MERPNSKKLISFAKGMRKAPSDSERALWKDQLNLRLEGPKFRRQPPVGPFIADFACEDCELIVEVDGLQHDTAIRYDEDRTTALEKLGWRALRFFAGDVVKEIDAVPDIILFAARPHPNPLP